MENLEDLLLTVEYFGFLPMFKNHIEGFSVEEMTPSWLWFTDQEGPWEWKGPAAQSGRCVYGKLYHGCAGFVSNVWLPHLANFRREGYDWESWYEDGMAPHKDQEIMKALAKGPMLSKDLKRMCNYRKDGNKGFDRVITRLQMQTFVCISNFEYAKDKYGKEYGWGIGRYATPEQLFGEDYVNDADGCTPQQSLELIMQQLHDRLPYADHDLLYHLIADVKV